jgi:hypothetical protein
MYRCTVPKACAKGLTASYCMQVFLIMPIWLVVHTVGSVLAAGRAGGGGAAERCEDVGSRGSFQREPRSGKQRVQFKYPQQTSIGASKHVTSSRGWRYLAGLRLLLLPCGS